MDRSTSRFLTFVTAAMLSPGLAPAASALGWTELEGDFSTMTVGEVRPLRARETGGNPYVLDDFDFGTYRTNILNPLSGIIGFSLSSSGPFVDALFQLPAPVDAAGNGATQILYFKALVPDPGLRIAACGYWSTCEESPLIAIVAAPPPPPPPPPAPEGHVQGPNAIGVGSVTPMYISFSHGPPGVSDTYHVTTTLASTMEFSASPTGPFAPSVDVPIHLNSDGGETTNGFYVRGVAASYGSNAPQAVGNIVACAATLPCLTPKPIHVVNVNYIYLTTYSGTNVPISNDPNVTGGKRIFVGKRTPTDTLAHERRRVLVRAQLSEPLANVRVTFKFFDVDDPTTNDPELDPNGSAGGDNRGSGAILSNPFADTDEAGQATNYLVVTQQPGDNFRVAAMARAVGGTSTFLDGVSVSGTNLVNGSVIDETYTQASAAAITTPLLTVWRRLHIERDTMGKVIGNSASGTITDVAPSGGGSALKVSPSVETGRFERGRIELQSPANPALRFSYAVVKNTATEVVTETPVLSQMTGWVFTLVDDDDFNANDGALPDGDEGETLPFPDMSLLADSDDPARNRLAPAFVRPIYDLIGEGYAPFVANTAPPTIPLLFATNLGSLFAFDNQGSEVDPDFWTIYALNAYQDLRERDLDPLKNIKGIEESLVGGRVDEVNGKGFAVYAEAQADYLRTCVLKGVPPKPINTLANYAVHEVGHLFGAPQGDGGIMSMTTPEYSASTLNWIRSASHP